MTEQQLVGGVGAALLSSFFAWLISRGARERRSHQRLRELLLIRDAALDLAENQQFELELGLIWWTSEVLGVPSDLDVKRSLFKHRVMTMFGPVLSLVLLVGVLTFVFHATDDVGPLQLVLSAVVAGLVGPAVAILVVNPYLKKQDLARAVRGLSLDRMVVRDGSDQDE